MCPSRLGTSRLGTSNVTLRNVTVHAWKSTGRFTACAKARADGRLLGGQTTTHWSENSGAFMDGSEERCAAAMTCVCAFLVV